MLDTLKVCLIQTDPFWENPDANRAELEETIASINESVDLIVLPEMFTTGFSVASTKLAEPMNHTTTRWMRQIASQYNTIICGSIAIADGGKFYNRFLWVKENEKVEYYDKKHLFRFGTESQLFSEGYIRNVLKSENWNFLPLICYDLRFPVWSRNKDLAYDVLIYSASWPSARIGVWETLLKARAIENNCYCIGVNRCGTDVNGTPHAGKSMIVNPKGEVMGELNDQPGYLIIELSKSWLTNFREHFPVHLDGDDFKLK